MIHNTPNDSFFDILGNDSYQKAKDIANKRLVYKTLENKFELSNDEVFHKESEYLESFIEVFELFLIQLKNDSKSDEHLLVDYYNYCKELFLLYQALEIPSDDMQKIKYIFKMISYSYLGQAWESGRRFILNYFNSILIEDNDNDTWDVKIFKTLYNAFLYLIKKDNWNDLEKAIDKINNLRELQKDFESVYLNNNASLNKPMELLSLYHFAKIIELLSCYLINGNTADIKEQIDYHFDNAIKASEITANFELSLLLSLLKDMSEQMIKNSIWWISRGVCSQISNFVKSITKLEHNAAYELLYPQREAIINKGLLNPAHKAIVVNLPTSSGKTIIAEFRMLQALNQFKDDGGWVAYIAPTRALVNQIAAKLKRDFEPLNIKVQKLSGSMDIDLYEDNLLKKTKTEKLFDVLVITPEKLNFLLRKNAFDELSKKLILAVVDEAHNIESDSRGLAYEILLANISNDCPKANFLLLTPFIPNAGELSKWLDSDNPQEVELDIDWCPNDRIIGAYYVKGEKRNWQSRFKTLITSNARIQIEKDIAIKKDSNTYDYTYSKIKNNKKLLTTIVSAQLIGDGNILCVCMKPKDCWDVAELLYNYIQPDANTQNDNDIITVQRFIRAELGDDFVLAKYLEKGIGIHHGGLSDEIRYLMEWLMENNKLKVLIATTTIAQGINFPVSKILMASYSYPYGKMPTKDFWNLVGRAGRMNHNSLGVVGIALNNENEEEAKKLKNYVCESTRDLYSVLKKLLENIEDLENFKFDNNFYFQKQALFVKWSEFLQYLTHIYNQIEDVSIFNNRTEIILRKTLGFNQITDSQKAFLIKQVKDYVLKLNNNRGLSKQSDNTGFSFETIRANISNISDLGLTKESLHSSNLFNENSKLKNIMGVMLKIPEINEPLKQIGIYKKDSNTLASIVSDWVNGNTIKEIALKYFKKENSSQSDTDIITECYQRLTRDISYSATWGMASIQKLSGIDFDNLTEEEKLEINNTSAMIYYGVNTNEAVLMRKNGVPRTISVALGKFYKENEENIFSKTPIETFDWIKNLTVSDWNNIAKKEELSVDGSVYHKIWHILNNVSSTN